VRSSRRGSIAVRNNQGSGGRFLVEYHGSAALFRCLVSVTTEKSQALHAGGDPECTVETEQIQGGSRRLLGPMTRTLNLERLWDKAKHASVSESDIVACEHLLENPTSEDLPLAVLVVGLTRKADERRQKIVERYFRGGRNDAERYSALRVLCRYWQLWGAYLPDLYSLTQPSHWDDDYATAEEATQLLGEYLYGHDDKEAWRKLLEIYDHAVEHEDTLKAGIAYSAIFVGLNGSEKALRAQLRDDLAVNSVVLDVARERSKLN
jgi:hypothetical protein